MKILAHTSFIGTTGYANHARSFFCALNKYHTVKVRNFTVGSGWKRMSNTPHNAEPYITPEMKDMLILQTLFNADKSRGDFPMYDYKGDFEPDVHIILMESNHYYYYEDYKGYKIGFCVFESTRFPEHFFNRLHYFDEMWVPTQWQADSLVEQGYPKEKISIVTEGVDVETFKPIDVIPKKEKFRFLYFGRWDYRKSTTEVLRAFGETFKDIPNVELISSVENPFPYDECKSTEDRMKKFDIYYDNIKYVKFVPREEYIKYLQEGHVFLSCARSEGWNLPLIEALSCGIPALYSNWGGQLQFAQGKGVPVNISHLRPANIMNGEVDGEYCEPDFMDLQSKMIDVYNNYDEYRNNALLDAVKIRNEFNWDKVARDASKILKEKMRKTHSPQEVKINFSDGPFVEILGDIVKEYKVEFIDLKNGNIEYGLDLKSNCWASASKKYHIDWMIKIKGIDNNFYYEHEFNPTGRRVLISFESKSLGDTLAWIPYVEKFRAEKNCKVICSTFHNKLFKDQYPNIEFVEPGSIVLSIYTLFRVGIFRKNGEIDFDRHPIDPKTEPLTKAASDILGLDYVELKPLLPVLSREKKKVVSIATHATAQSKYWNNPTGWQQVVDYIVSKGYEVKLISREEDGYMGNKDPKNVTRVRSGSVENVIKILQESELFIGLGSGLSWLSWAVGTETILISGFTDTFNEPQNGIRRVINKDVCHGCWNKHVFDPSDWYWCPVHKGTDRQFECSKLITSASVIKQIDLALGL